METLLQDIRFGVRMLLKNKGFTFVAVAALALGIGASTAIFSVVDAVLLRPLPYANPERIVSFDAINPPAGITDGNLSAPDFSDWQKRSDALERAALFVSAGAILAPEKSEPVHVPRAVVTSDFFPALGVQPALGRSFRPEEDKVAAEPVALLGYNLWHRFFGADPKVIGQRTSVNGRMMTVVGVMPAGFAFPNGDTEIWSSLQVNPAEEARDNRSFEAVGRLKAGVSLEQAQAQLSAINARLAQQFHETNKGWDVHLFRLQDRLVREVRPYLLALLGAVFFLLLIACANVANLLLARAAVRRREIALRAALGANRARVWRQLLTESLLLALLGGAVGMLLSTWLTDSLASFALADLPRLSALSSDWRALLMALGLSVLMGLLFGTAPALHGSKLNLNEALNEGGRSGGDSVLSHRTRDLFLVAQVALSLVLLVGAGLLIKSFQRLRDVQPGFNPAGVLTMSISLPYAKYAENPQRAQFFERLVANVGRLPGVESAAAVLSLPLNGSNYLIGRSFVREGRPLTNDESVGAMYDVATPGYFRTLQIPLIAGRDFTPNDTPSSAMVVIINRTTAERYFASPEASLGKRIIIWRDEKFPREIVGVVGDSKHSTLDAELTPQMFVPYAQDASWGLLSLALRAKIKPAALTEAVRQQVLALDKGQPIYRVQTMEEVLQKSTAPRRASMLLLSVFAAASLLLAAIGIYGVMAYSVTLRTREIGIRMALGAKGADVLRLIARQGMLLAIIGAAIGIGASLFLSRALGGLLFDVRPADPTIYAAILFLLISVAFVACYWPARRAARVNPVTALAQE
ncbi:MAG: ABC transporter permease [Chthoniobacterales bacterium]|nr:ABC transporter permease [Chthoniobacterales bacterium]